ncbi:tetratricopeptide repeat protein [Oculatella sp. LEGE 06141]|uniref:tetratricopeptide repeat protein n=1 Tax=Oculatella sp. LEGE 06141 TaxID=1828648 RepID=UPI00187F6B8D|nr:tetratricopeptide repeat protein [Oculatella sp. LEGE 06141]MBE9179644.1 tetratricopeptide repeat protein [Oculatella sp. LEGE 06141]
MQKVMCGMAIASLFAAAVGLNANPGLALPASHYRELGLRYRQQGQFPEAIAAFQTSVELEPDNLAGRVTLGWTLHLADRDREAAIALQETLQRDPFYVPALNAAGIVYLVNDDWLAAALTHTWAILLSPDNEIAYYNLSLACQQMQQTDCAIATAQTAAKLEPENPHPLVALAIAQQQQGTHAIAHRTYQQAVELDTRYRNRDFLNGLTASGFSPQQIEQAKQLLDASP